MTVLELTVTTCIHLVRSDLNKLNIEAIGSGVIVRYKERFFICTVSHFSDFTKQNVGILTGRTKNGECEVYYLGNFSSMTEYIIDNSVGLDFNCADFEEKGNKLDIAFREILKLPVILQSENVYDLGEELGKLTIKKDGKNYAVVDKHFTIDKEELCSFSGRIRPLLYGKDFMYNEALYWGLSIKNIGEYFIEMDLGSPIENHKRFQGCSGAPILDTQGRLIGLVTHGEKDTSKSSIYGFRFDKVKQWIDMMYFCDNSDIHVKE